jgi:hypothetical protein
MKLKLDLHPIFNDGVKIEAALESAISDAIEKRATEIEIIPGKGSGALKKSVLRFLDRPEIKARYHRIEKDGDNWGKLYVHFRHLKEDPNTQKRALSSTPTMNAACICCGAEIKFALAEFPFELRQECPSCGSPNKISVSEDRRGKPRVSVDWGYE